MTPLRNCSGGRAGSVSPASAGLASFFLASSTFLVLPRKGAATKVANHSMILRRVSITSLEDHVALRGGVSNENYWYVCKSFSACPCTYRRICERGFLRTGNGEGLRFGFRL